MLNEPNAVYLVTAYGVFLGAILTYGIVLWIRARAAKRELRALDEHEAQFKHQETKQRD